MSSISPIKKRKYFGTDGIRGRVGRFPITPDFMLKLGWAAGCVLARNSSKAKVLIGKDTRISGYMFESALEAGLSAAGIDIGLLGPLPTPAVAYLTKTLNAQVGIVISASHNLYMDNGIKFFTQDGKKLPDEVEWEIEQQLEMSMHTVDSEALGKAIRVVDAADRYVKFCKSSFPSQLSLSGLKIVVDCANGAAYQVAPRVFKELGAEVVVLAAEPNGLNINDHCGATQIEVLRQKVLEQKADAGVALDGDGDRVIMVDHQGEVVDGDELLYIIANYFRYQGKLFGGVVGTVMSNFGLEAALNNQGIDFIRTKVGDRYIMDTLQQQQWTLGGESSGHIICLDLATTGDGIISALQVLAAIQQLHTSLNILKSSIQKLPQVLLNVKLQEKIDLETHQTIQEAIKAAESQLKGQGRILLRLSGTEPLVRIMVESRDKNQASAIAAQLAECVEAVFS